MSPFRFLLAVPEVRHIPTFAMIAEKTRVAHKEFALPSLEGHAAAFDNSTTQALRAGHYGAYRLVGSRTRLNQQTALYATWVAFDESDAACAFERDHLSLGWVSLSKRLDAALQDAQAGEDMPNMVVEDCASTIQALTLLVQTL